jgi:hypothetical protein
LAVTDVGRADDQRADVDLTGAAEDDAVGVHDQHRAGRADRAEYLCRVGGRVRDPVEHDPAGTLLTETEVGLRADVEGGPVENRLGLGLLHVDVCATVGGGGLGGSVGSLPEIGAGRRTRRDLQAADG